MKTTFVPLVVAALSLFAFADEPTWRPDAGFRGTFKHNDYTFAISLDYVKPKALKKNQRIDCRMSLEQGCQVYDCKAVYLAGRILIAAESIYLQEGDAGLVGLGHFDCLSLQCDLDSEGTVSEARVILPDGAIHRLKLGEAAEPISMKYESQGFQQNGQRGDAEE